MVLPRRVRVPLAAMSMRSRVSTVRSRLVGPCRAARTAPRAPRTSPPPSGSPHYSPRRRGLLNDQLAWSLLILEASTRDQSQAPLPARHVTMLRSEEPFLRSRGRASSLPPLETFGVHGV